MVNITASFQRCASVVFTTLQPPEALSDRYMGNCHCYAVNEYSQSFLLHYSDQTPSHTQLQCMHTHTHIHTSASVHFNTVKPAHLDVLANAK